MLYSQILPYNYISPLFPFIILILTYHYILNQFLCFCFADFHIFIILIMNILPFLHQDKHFVEDKTNPGPFKIQKSTGENIEQYVVDGQWNEQENARYAAFLEQNKKLLARRTPSKAWTEFQNMAKFVKTRNLRQCKTHHYRLYNKFSSIQGILSHFLESSSSFQKIFKKYQKQLISSSTTISSPLKEQVKVQQGYKPIIPEVVKKGNNQFRTAESYTGDQDSNPFQTMKAFQENANKMFHVQNGYGNFLNQSGFGYTYRPMIDQDREQQWVECHTVFLMWANKLRKLTSQPQREKKYDY